MSRPINPTAGDWRSVPEAESMTQGSRLLQKFCTGAGLTPLASEWWHFNDNEAITNDLLNLARGDFIPSTCVSMAPDPAPV